MTNFRMHRHGFFGETPFRFTEVPQVDLSREPEFQTKLKEGMRVVTLSEIAALFILIPLFSLGHTRPWLLKWYIDNRGGIAGAIPALLAILSLALGFLLYVIAIVWAFRKVPQTGIPVWKQTFPFVARHFTAQHIRKEYLDQNPELLTVDPPLPPCFNFRERAIEMYPLDELHQQRPLEEGFQMNQTERRPIFTPHRWQRLERLDPPAQHMPAPPPYTQSLSPPPSYDAS